MLVSVLSLGVFALLAHAHFIPQEFRRDLYRGVNASQIGPRALSSTVVIEAPNFLGCTDAEISELTQAVDDAQSLAAGASAVLGTKGVEKSDAYLVWFGAANAKAATRISIKTSNYEALIADLVAPSTRIAEVTMTNLDTTGLTFGCRAADSASCKGGTIAVTHNSGNDGLSGNIIGLCPAFFQLPDLPTMVTDWRRGTFNPSQGFALLHEVQHAQVIVGQNRRCVDAVDPTGGGCYSPKCCSSLPDKQKITNAQNMGFFALEVFADPSSAAEPGGSCAIQRRSIAEAGAELFERAKKGGKAKPAPAPAPKPNPATKPAANPKTTAKATPKSTQPATSRPATTQPSSSKPTATSSFVSSRSSSASSRSSSASSRSSSSSRACGSAKPVPSKGTAPADLDGFPKAEIALIAGQAVNAPSAAVPTTTAAAVLP